MLPATSEPDLTPAEGSIAGRIAHYEAARGAHASGSFGTAVLEAIERLAPVEIGCSVETGCGKSTVLLSHLSQRHLVFTVDDGNRSDGSLTFVRQCGLFRSERVEFVLGPTQLTMPRHLMPPAIDLALIDGPHAYPFPDLEYFYIYPHLRHGALLIIDDIHIPTIARMYAILREDDMFEPLHVEGQTAFLRRTAAPMFPKPIWDGWERQGFNVRHLAATEAAAGEEAYGEGAEAVAVLRRLEAQGPNTGLNWEQILVRQYCAAFEQPQTMVDVGAHLGAHTAYFVSQHAKQVVCFEPQPWLAADLRAKFAQAQVHEVALSDRAERVEFLVYLDAPGESGLREATPVNGRTKTISVKAARLDDFGLRDVSFIKSDCNGSDLLMLAGAAATVAASRPLIAIEWGGTVYRPYGFAASALRDWAIRNGYVVCDLFGNPLVGGAYERCIDRFYWDYLLVPAENTELAAKLRDNGRKLLASLDEFRV
jgi:FkbM family methyltransferase